MKNDLNNTDLIYENILESMNNGVIALDFEGKIITFNSAASKILGIDPKKVINKYYSEVFFKLTGNDEFNDVLINVVMTKETYVYKEVNFLRKDKNKIPLGITSSLLKDDKGKEYGIVAVFFDLTELRKTKFLEETLTRYVTKQVVDLIMEHPDSIILDGEERQSTILFTDIRNFTSIAEKMDPKELVQMLRSYFTLMVDASFKYQGTVDKFIGDSIMVIFGAPTPQPDHALLAVNTALEMQNSMMHFNEQYNNKSFAPIKMGIGINTGNIVVGNIGSKDRLEYTAIGDSVNLASRLEGTNKNYGTNIIISENTYQLIKEEIYCRKLDKVMVKGKEIAINIYEVIDKYVNLKKSKINQLEIFNEGLKYYKDRDWDKAIKEFEKFLKISKHDEPSKLYIKRCKHYKDNPPGNNWDGVFKLLFK